jgi:metal-dependent amidase/aminoacylase/carboxypeptidase family protein
MILCDIKEHKNGKVKLIFQPAEEKNPGGASVLIKHEVLKNPAVDVIFGQHISQIKQRELRILPVSRMASQDELYITIRGKTHGAKPHTTVDPIVIASQFILHCRQLYQEIQMVRPDSHNNRKD